MRSQPPRENEQRKNEKVTKVTLHYQAQAVAAWVTFAREQVREAA